mgnify:CR=1 FL=1
MNYQDYINTDFLILVPVLYFIGLGLKKSTLPDKWIPLTLGVVGVFLCGIWTLSVIDLSSIQSILTGMFTAVTQGILVAGTSVYVNQIYVQSKKEE